MRSMIISVGLNATWRMVSAVLFWYYSSLPGFILSEKRLIGVSCLMVAQNLIITCETARKTNAEGIHTTQGHAGSFRRGFAVEVSKRFSELRKSEMEDEQVTGLVVQDKALVEAFLTKEHGKIKTVKSKVSARNEDAIQAGMLAGKKATLSNNGVYQNGIE